MVSFWGSLGASHMNECMVDFFRREDAEGYPFRHIHAVGKGGWEAMEQKLRAAGTAASPTGWTCGSTSMTWTW